MGKHYFKTKADDAWFYFDPQNVLDTLRVVFVSECDESEDPSDAWHRLSDEAKNNRIKAIHTALKDITITDVEFVHPQVRNACDGITNVFNLFQFMDRNPDAILTRVDWAWDIEYGLSAEDIRAYISVGTLLKNLAPFIVEDILDIEAALYTHGQEKATPVMEDKHNTIVLNACDKDAWLVADESNVTDSLCVIFESERIYEKPLTASWDAMSPLAKDVRKRAIGKALHDIAVDKTVFTNTEAYPACDDIMNLYELFKFLQEHPEARFTEVYSDNERFCSSSTVFTNTEAYPACDDIMNLYELFKFLQEHPEARLTEVYSDNERFCSSSIGVRELLLHFAEDIAETILDIEHCECEDSTDDSMEEKLSKLDSAIARCKHEVGSDDKVVRAGKEARMRIAAEMSPVEDFKAFMKEQYDKHKDRVDAAVDAYKYIANDIACTNEVVSIDDPVNHPKHYKASNGLEAIDCIEAFVGDLPGDIGYLIGNAMKYLCRFDKKGKPVEDLQKARWYIERAIKDIESRKM